jgi:predicted 3-demethylubiquinone-9 3-methyltransferase (glyoxalase superfamily)
MTTITPCLWFDGDGLEAAEFYVSLFPDSRIDDVSAAPDGSPLIISFTLMGRPFQALNGGPQFTFTEAVSLVIPCDGQVEVDRYWSALTQGGEESMCGWLKDRFGLSWQVVPDQLSEILGDPDPDRAARATQAMLQMRKLDIDALRAAADRAPA